MPPSLRVRSAPVRALCPRSPGGSTCRSSRRGAHVGSPSADTPLGRDGGIRPGDARRPIRANRSACGPERRPLGLVVRRGGVGGARPGQGRAAACRNSAISVIGTADPVLVVSVLVVSCWSCRACRVGVS
jgi:hypothetical protein